MYPSKKQILAPPRPEYPKGLMKIISEWKEKWYKKWWNQDIAEQWYALDELSNSMSYLYKKEPPRIILPWHTTVYQTEEEVIYLAIPSVISFLHEYAHHLFGSDELTACRWSVWLYQLRFRNDYNKLVWKDHLLVKRSSSGTRRLPSKKKVTSTK